MTKDQTKYYDDYHAVSQAEYKLAEAHFTLDLKTIDHLLHPDYVILQPGGLIETKIEVLTSYQTGSRQWETASVRDLDVRIFGDTAIVIGLWQASGWHEQERFDYKARFLSTWLKCDGRWKNIAYQSTEIDE